MKLSDEQVNDIAQSLDCGFNCYIHRETHEVITIPSESRIYAEMDEWKDDIRKVEKVPGQYLLIEPLMSNQSFRMMAAFAENVDDDKVRRALVGALNDRKPFANFKFQIDNSGPYRQKWFDFKNQWLMDYVREELEIVDNDGEED